MSRTSFLNFATACLALATLGALANVSASAEYRISGPVAHENLAIYFVHGPSAAGPVPLTLQEALEKGVARVYETGDVNQLDIENLSEDEIFVQSGDIVKGGRQDRVLSVSLLLQPRSGRLPIAAFCVEEGRWSARGKEDVRTFNSSREAVPSRQAKLAMQAPITRPTSTMLHSDSTRSTQSEIWKDVRSLQRSLSDNMSVRIVPAESPTSLQLMLENDKLKDVQNAYVRVLQPAGEKEADIVGYVFAVNGKLNSADIYPSNGLFRKMWPKLLSATTTEAIGTKNAEATRPPPSTNEVMAFLEAADHGKASEVSLTDRLLLNTRAGDQAYRFETRLIAGGFVHRNYLAK